MAGRETTRAALAVPLVLTLGAALGHAGGQGGVEFAGWPVFGICGALAFAVNGLAFVPAFAARTERFYDLTGSFTYLAVTACAAGLGNGSARSLLLGSLVAAWALRLGSFLFARIRREGRDGRFDDLKRDFARFLLAWMLQGLWVLVTAGCALAAMTAAASPDLDAFAAVGTLVWAGGFAVEVAADRQKEQHRERGGSRHFIDTGLWAWSRHPNYCGEIVLWTGIALIAFPALQGAALSTLVSPLFVHLLLTRISGIPLLEARADARWGHDPAYLAYKARTPLLWPRRPRA